MKKGDLVRIKFISNAQIKRNMMSKEPVNEIGIVIEVAEKACKVMFPSANNKIRSMLQTSLDVISVKG